MNRLIVTGAVALFLVACTHKESPTPAGNTPAAAAVATDAKAVFELGQKV